MQRAVLPVGGSPHLCAVNEGQIQPLAAAPGYPDAQYFLSPDAAWLAVLDDQRKRAGLFELLPGEPWLRRSIPFGTLPRRCIGHVALGLDGTLYVGGHGKAGEALWRNSASRDGTWNEIELPEGLRKHGKAIDGLHVIDGHLIAVDDIIVPKWLLVYAMRPDSGLELERQVKLPSHTTNERVLHSCIGPMGKAANSKPGNPGTGGRNRRCATNRK